MKVYLIGFMGSGKTYWGRQLSKRLTLPFFDLDEQITEAEGKSINEVFEQHGEEYFRLREKDILHLLTESHDSFIMACGGGTPCYFNNIEYLNRSGMTIWINTPIPVLAERLLKEKEHRPLLKDLSDEQVKNFISKKFADRRLYYEQASLTVDENMSLEHFIENIFHA
ncbi:MAG TPA: shikimate kinase [Chitinophagaceae bacterium]|nr:shikimate kinase [Chitinophagaceae bacterium]